MFKLIFTKNTGRERVDVGINPGCMLGEGWCVITRKDVGGTSRYEWISGSILNSRGDSDEFTYGDQEERP